MELHLPVPGVNELTDWGRDEMAAIFQITLSNSFSWMKMLEFRSKFHWSLFLRVQLAIVHHWFRWWLGTDQVTSSVAVRYKKSISIIETVISIDYRYIDFLASYFSDRCCGIDRVGDNWRTVNTSANPHISDQLTELRTEYTC